jgi:hypothetical protein
MANRRFIDFPVATTVGANDIILIWQDGLNKQTTKATILSGLPSDLEDLADVNISGLTNGQILRYDSTTGKWVNTDQGNLDLDDLNDVSIVSPTNGQVLVYNSSTSRWENSSGGYVPYTGAVTTVDLGAQTIQAGSFVKVGGTSAQFLKADGSIDSNTYLTTGSASATYVPYTGATADVNLGTHDLAAERGTFANNGSSDTLTINHTSGSGYGIIVTKGGNNEALYVSKTSGSGNAMTVVGGRTSLVDLALSSVTNTTGDFLTLSGGVVHKRTAAEVRTDIGAGTGNGTVTSVAALTLGTSGTDLSSTVANGTTTPVITLNVPTASSSNRGVLSSADWTTFNNKQNALTNPVTGTGTTNYLPKFTGSTTIGNSQVFDNGTNVGIGTASPADLLNLDGGVSYPFLRISSTGNTTARYLKIGLTDALLHTINAVGPSTSINFLANNAERMRIASTGNLLVGTTTDAGFKLDVNGTGRFSGNVGVGTAPTSTDTLSIANTNARNELQFIGSEFTNIYSQTTSGIQFGITSSGNSAGIDFLTNNSIKLSITSGGNVGIGVTPSTILTINGGSGAYPTLGTATANALMVGRNDKLVGMFLGYAADGNGWIQQMRTDSATAYNLVLQPVGGNVLIGSTSDPGYKLYVNGNTYIKGSGNTSASFALVVQNSSSNNLFLVRNDGQATFSSLGTGTVTATDGTLSTISDLTYKIDDGFIDSAIKKVLNLKPRYFYWNEKSGLPKDIRQLGFYAQEVNQALGEEAANTPQDKNTPWGISDRSIIAMLTKAIQELKQEIDTLKN